MGVLLACGSRVTFICAFLFLQNSMLTSSEDVNENEAIYQSTGEEDDVAYQNIFQHQDGPENPLEPANDGGPTLSVPNIPTHKKKENTSYLGRVYTEYMTCVNTSMKEYCCDASNVKQYMTTTEPYDLSCIVPGLSPRGACLAGLYNRSGVTAGAPPGYFSPARLSCLLKCLDGAHCEEKDVLKQVNKSLPWSGLPECSLLGYCCGTSKIPFVSHIVSPLDVHGNETNSSSVLVCPGMADEVPCPDGHFCVNASYIETCPSGYFCRAGSTQPKRCPMESWCPRGSETDITNFTGVTLLIVFAFVVLTGVQIYEYRRRLEIKRRKQGSIYEDEMGVEGQRLLLESLPKARITTAHESSSELYELEVEMKDISLDVPQKSGAPLRVLSHVSATFCPGEITAVMGPSGAGKTSIVSVLMGQAGYGNVSGDIRFNGLVRPVHDFKTITGYVSQDDVMHTRLTVREALVYQAQLRLPQTWTCKETKARVDQTLEALAIRDIADSIIGDGERRGISGGQRKRVNIGMELVTRPRLLVLDEPTSGLDAFASLQIVQLLRKIASQDSLTVIAVIHQPRFEVFRSFDKLLLLTRGGLVAYNGSIADTESYFVNELGVPKPYNCNPADYIIDVVSGALPSTEGELHAPAYIAGAWQSHRDGRAFVEEAGPAKMHEMQLELKTKSPKRNIPSFVRQFFIFLCREMVLHVRSIRVILLDIFLIVLGAAFLGGSNANFSIHHAMSVYVLNSIVVGLTTMTASLRVFGQYHPIYRREAGAGINRVAYFLAANLSHFPILFCYSVVYMVVLYSLLTPRSHYIDVWIVIAAGMFATSGLGYLVSNLFSHRSAQMAVVVMALTSAMLSGQSPTLAEIHQLKVVGPTMTSMSYARWMCQPLFEKEVDSYPTVFWRTIVGSTNYYNFTMGSRYTFCVFILCIFGLATRLLSMILMLAATSKGRTKK
eukprot:m.6727 g.6727  ORF g.6727 m.6727 type:complete len:947 (+) comp3573_c0_seq1:175-3015(+)